jgi:hypothetical protein
VHAHPGSEFIWDGYTFAYSQVAVDTDGLVGALVAEKAALSEREAATLAPRLLDQFLNSIYRSVVEATASSYGHSDVLSSWGDDLRLIPGGLES